MTAAAKESKLVSGKLYPTLIKFTIPFLLSSLLQSLYGTVDLLVIGNFSNMQVCLLSLQEAG